jgi:hypothetical protein
LSSKCSLGNNKGANNLFVITNMTTKEEKKDEKKPSTDKREVIE